MSNKPRMFWHSHNLTVFKFDHEHKRYRVGRTLGKDPVKLELYEKELQELGDLINKVSNTKLKKASMLAYKLISQKEGFVLTKEEVLNELRKAIQQ